jgi:flagellar hook-basal body complex protein FliE
MTSIRSPLPAQFQRFSLSRTNPLHGDSPLAAYVPPGKAISELGNKIGAESVLRSGTFDEMMLQSLDKVSADQQFAEGLLEAAVTDPGSVDAHDLTIAQAKAAMSLSIARTVLSRVVQGWRDLINTR